jgi:hypothetical protein
MLWQFKVLAFQGVLWQGMSEREDALNWVRLCHGLRRLRALRLYGNKNFLRHPPQQVLVPSHSTTREQLRDTSSDVA